MASSPLVSVARPQGSGNVRKRRALKPGELQLLINAARERPLHDEMYKPRGKSNKEKKKAAKPANTRPEIRERFLQLGRERALIYKAAIYTGLRKNEITQLCVKHLNLNLKPYASIELPAEFTKNRQEARILLVPELARELKKWIADTCKTPEAKLFAVSTQLVPIMKKDLKFAGIPFKDEKGRVADFHELRKTAGTFSASPASRLESEAQFSHVHF